MPTLTPLLHFQVKDQHFTMIFVQGGTFWMGADPERDEDTFGDEVPLHLVNVPNFYLAQHQVNQNLWQALMDDNPAYFTGMNHPIETVSWDDAQGFIQKLNTLTGHSFRLPSEAEWEYAARGGQYGLGCRYAGSNRLKEVGWYGENSHEESKKTSQKYPNELGLYDMSGNVWEWCEDDWHRNYEGAPQDGSAWIDAERGSYRVYRGGAWSNNSQSCRSAYRYYWTPVDRYSHLGFRLALSLQSVGQLSASL